VTVIAAWLYWQFCPQAKGPSHPAEALAKASYVGAAACAECHRSQYDAWKGSHHALSMQPASPQTVLGDFKDANFTFNEVASRFFQREGQFFVNTDGFDGQPSDYAIKYAFGLTPLQQYLIELPDGRMQALSIAWDSRDKQQGGQRWFHLYPDEKVNHDDPLHWTGPYQNWNFMCADCHSTQVRHNYNADTDQFNTQWNEINVACEACHGPGSQHLEWAKQQSSIWALFKRKDDGNGLAVDVSGRQKPDRIKQMQQSTSLTFKEGTELKTCAVCHARRTALTNEFVPAEGFDQHFLAALLRPELYFEDGQIKDEVYEYNSFRQSKMFAKGVTCSDCHEPHALKLRGDVQTVCLQCHEGSRYDATAHHHHAGNGQVKCVDCHMPQKNYMVVDPRRDHSFRVPRPDLSQRYAVPNACAQCHRGKDADWAANAVRTWLGRDAKGFQRFAEAFHKTRTTEAGAEQSLREVLRDPTEPPVVKGSLLAEAGGFLYAIADDVKNSLHADAVAERLGALSAIENLPIAQRWPLAEHLLQDSERNVRIEAARLLLDPALDAQQKQQIAKPLAELQQAARIYASRPQWRLIAAGIEAKLGHQEKAVESYEAALKIQPSLTQAYANLADTYRTLGNEAKASETLDRGLKLLPSEGALHYAKGLAEIRQKQTAQGMKELKQATELSPDDRIFAYAYAVGLYSQGEKKVALAFLQKRLEAHPSERNNLYLLVQLAGREDRTELITPYIPVLKQLIQSDPQAKQLMMLLGSSPAH